MLWILQLLRTKIRAVAWYVVRGVAVTVFCALGAGAVTEAAAIVVGFLSLWKQTGMQPSWTLAAGFAALSAPLAASVMGVVGLIGLLIVSVGVFFQLIGDPKDPNDVLNQAWRAVEKPPRRIGPPIALKDEHNER
jgi:hypothetical protein